MTPLLKVGYLFLFHFSPDSPTRPTADRSIDEYVLLHWHHVVSTLFTSLFAPVGPIPYAGSRCLFTVCLCFTLPHCAERLACSLALKEAAVGAALLF